MIRYITFLVAALALTTRLSAAPSDTDVSDLLNAYFATQRGLAGDDLAAAKGAASSLAEKAQTAGASAELISSAAAVAGAADMKAARTEFQLLSNHFQSLAESTGTDDAPVYVARCPMAFGGKGGTWLQDNKTIANPYYGSMMLRCGSVIKEVGGSTDVVDTNLPGKPCCPQ